MIAESVAVIPGGTGERFVQKGSELRLRCRISKTVRAGESPPRISWFRNGTRLRYDDGRVAVSPVSHKRVSEGGTKTRMYRARLKGFGQVS